VQWRRRAWSAPYHRWALCGVFYSRQWAPSTLVTVDLYHTLHFHPILRLLKLTWWGAFCCCSIVGSKLMMSTWALYVCQAMNGCHLANFLGRCVYLEEKESLSGGRWWWMHHRVGGPKTTPHQCRRFGWMSI
jgi:hypothetical protein